jgi:hypothetical protein
MSDGTDDARLIAAAILLGAQHIARAIENVGVGNPPEYGLPVPWGAVQEMEAIYARSKEEE